ncbi:caspase family protein [Akkermansiaceae bacterium]|nr:caspase family protein [Akkermansiaceae bacterium]
MENAKTSLNLVFLDCCRSVPNLMTKARTGTQGLAPYQSESESTLVSYATKHGMVAYDNSVGTNSLYTATLSQEIQRPGIVVEEVLRRVARGVFYKSGKRQRPWSYGNLLEPIYLAGKHGTPPPVAEATQPPPPAPTQPQAQPAPAHATFTNVGKLTRNRIRNARSTEPSQVYFGDFGGVQAAVSLQWLDDMDAVRGSIFPISRDTKGIDRQWQFLGTNYVQGEIDIHIYDGSKLIANGSLRKHRSGDVLSWIEKTSRGENISISRTLQRKPAPEVKSQYRGKIGTSDVRVTLDWGKDRFVRGFYKSLTSGKTYLLRGDNTIDGFIYLDEFNDGNISARILLEKTYHKGKLVWAGKIFNLDGRINPVAIFKE